jgi:ketosteroid isomerase-like protein
MTNAACPSDWALERYVLHELPPDSGHIDAHVERCEACRQRIVAQRADSAAFLHSAGAAKLRRALLHPEKRRGRQRWMLGCVAAAALALLFFWQYDPARKSLGADATLAAEQLAVLRFQDQWLTAVCKKDVDALERILADDYTYTDTTGARSGKADDLRRARSTSDGLVSFQTSNVQARVYGDVAVLTGQLAVEGLNQGKPYAAQVMFTDTLARIDGQWRAVAAHVSAKAPSSPTP